MSSGGKKASAKRTSSKSKKGQPLERTLTKVQEAKVENAFIKFCDDTDRS